MNRTREQASVVAVRQLLIRAPRSTVYEVMVDRERYGEIMPMRSTLLSPGIDSRQGVGAVHLLGHRPFALQERITELVPDERMAYEVVKGLPVRSHQARITLEEHRDGTIMRCRMENIPGRVPRLLIRPVLVSTIYLMTRAISREAERRERAGPSGSA